MKKLYTFLVVVFIYSFFGTSVFATTTSVPLLKLSSGYEVSPRVAYNDTSNDDFTITAGVHNFGIPQYSELSGILDGATINSVHVCLTGYVQPSGIYGKPLGITSDNTDLSAPVYYSGYDAQTAWATVAERGNLAVSNMNLKCAEIEAGSVLNTEINHWINDGYTLAVNWTSSTGTWGLFDTATLVFDYTEPSIQVATSSATLDPDQQYALINFEGNFTKHYNNQVCEIQVYEKNNSAFQGVNLEQFSSTPVAFVYWNFAYRSTRHVATTRVGTSNMYNGRLDSADTANYYADNIQAPIHTYGTYSYPLISKCWRENCTSGVCVVEGDLFDQKNGVDPTSPFYYPDFDADPPEMVDIGGVIMPDCQSDIICSVQQWVIKTINLYIMPNPERVKTQYALSFNQLMTKAPFSYASQIFSKPVVVATPSTSLRVDDTPEQTPISDIVFYFAESETLQANGVQQSYAIADTNGTIGTVAYVFKSVVSVFILIFVLFYQINWIKNFFD